MTVQVLFASILLGLAALASAAGDAADLTDVPAASTAPRDNAEQELFSGDWPSAPGHEVTGALCGSCHSLAIVKQQRLSRADWDELLDWMVEEQGMVQLELTIRTNILDYLSSHFGIPDN